MALKEEKMSAKRERGASKSRYVRLLLPQTFSLLGVGVPWENVEEERPDIPPNVVGESLRESKSQL